MFTDFYSWCTSLGDKLLNGGVNEDFVDYYTAYFVDTSVCSTIFWTGMGIAAVFAILFYFGVCNFSFRLAKRRVWLCVLALLYATTVFTTIPLIVGHDAEDSEDSTGIFAVSKAVEGNKLDGTTDGAMRDELSLTASDFREQFHAKEDGGTMIESLPMEMALVNAFYAILCFFILSILFKRYTTHGAAIPF